jgi:AAA15 family ATPase/GTPase
MFQKITVANFRGFRELRLESLGRVNLVVGDNNVGKTSLLEAIFLDACMRHVPVMLRVGIGEARCSC